MLPFSLRSWTTTVIDSFADIFNPSTILATQINGHMNPNFQTTAINSINTSDEDDDKNDVMIMKYIKTYKTITK